MAPVKLHMRFF